MTVTIAAGAVKEITLDAGATVLGEGAIGTARINADGVTIQQTPESVVLRRGVVATVGGKRMGTMSRGGRGSVKSSGSGDGEVKPGDGTEGDDPGTGDPNEPEPPLPVDIFEIKGVTPPVSWEEPVTAVTETEQYAGEVTWDPGVNQFAQDIAYTATVTLKAKDGFTFAGLPTDPFTVAGATYVAYQGPGVITATFPKTMQFAGGKGTKDEPWQKIKD